MTALTLKIDVVRINQVTSADRSDDQAKTFRFGANMTVGEVLEQIVQKTGEGGDDHGLYQAGIEGKRPARWLRPERTLQYYDLRQNDELQFKKKQRPVKVRLLDDTVKTILIDDSKSVGELVEIIGKKIGLKNPDEFSLQTMRKKGGCVLMAGQWLVSAQTLGEQLVKDDDTLVLKKKFFVDDANVGRDDPVQLHLVYVQCRDAIVDGDHPVSDKEAVEFCALQCQIDFGNHNPAMHQPGWLKMEQTMPPSNRKPGMEKAVVEEYKKLVGMTEINAKYRYVQACRALKTYGVTFFNCELPHPNDPKKKIPIMMGITRDGILIMDPQTKVIQKEYPLVHLKRWAASPVGFSLDFAEYEKEYVSVTTSEGEAMAQLIGGYIDILLKKRKDTGVVLADDDSEVGSVESVGRARGMATPATAANAAAMMGGMGGLGGQLSPAQLAAAKRAGTFGAQAIQVTDPASAMKAIQDMLNSLDAKGQGFGITATSFNPQQLAQQLLEQQGALAEAAKRLVDMMLAPGTLDRNMLNNYARELALATGNVLSAARQATAGLPDDDMPLFDGARAVAEAIKNLLQASRDLAADPNNPEKREALARAMDALSQAGKFLESAQRGALADDGSRRLLLEAAKAVAAATNAMCAKAEGSAKGLPQGARDKLLLAAKNANNVGDRTAATARTLAPVIIDPGAKQEIEVSSSDLKRAAALLLAAAKEGGLMLGDMTSLNDAARRVNEALAQLLSASQAAEGRQGTEKDLAEAANAILHGTTQILSAKGKPQIIADQANHVLAASGRLIAASKTLAANAPDEATRNRLLMTAKRVAEATKALMGEANSAVQNPADEEAYDRLSAAAKLLADNARLMVGDASRETAMKHLRSQAKYAAAATTGLITAAQLAAAFLEGSPDEQSLLEAARRAAEALSNMMNCLGDAAQHPDDAAANNRLMDSTKSLGPMAFSLIATVKQTSNKVSDTPTRQNATFAANETNVAVRALLDALRGVSSVAGVAEIEEAVEQFDLILGEIEASLQSAEAGTLAPAPGQTRDDALELLNVGVKSLAAATKDIAMVRDARLGPASKNLSSAVAQVVDAARAVASTSNSKTTQKVILSAAKNLATEAASLTKNARQVVESPSDAQLGAALSGSVKDVADALQGLIASSKGSDPGAREVEDALRLLQEEAARIQRTPVRVPGDFNSAADDLSSAARALGAATQHVANTAKENPGKLGASVQTAVATIPVLVNAANAAANTSPDPSQAKNIAARAYDLTDALKDFYTKARIAAAKNGEDPQVNIDLSAAAKKVSDLINALLAAVSSQTPAQLEIDQAVKDAQSHAELFNDSTIPNVPGNPFQALTDAAKSMAGATTGVVKSSAGNASADQLAGSASGMANALRDLINATKATAMAGAGSNPLALHSRRVVESAKKLEAVANRPVDADSRKALVDNSKEIAASASALVAAAKQVAVDFQRTNPDGTRAIQQAAVDIGSGTGAVVNAAKALASGTGSGAELAQACQALVTSVNALNKARGGGGGAGTFSPTALSAEAQELVNAARAVCNEADSLLRVSRDVIYGKKQKAAAAPEITGGARGVTTAIQSLIGASNNLKPGARELDNAIKTVEAGSNELQETSLNAAIGLMENSAPAGSTLQSNQEKMVEIAREVATGVKEFVGSTRGTPEQIGASAEAVAHYIPNLVAAAKATASSTKDANKQQSSLELGKSITDTILGLMNAVKAGNPAQIGAYAKSTSDAIQALLNALKSDVMGLRELDEAIKAINAQKPKLATSLEQIPPAASYKVASDSLVASLKALASGLGSLVNDARTSGDKVGASATNVAAVTASMVDATLESAATTKEGRAKSLLVSGADAIVTKCAKIVADAKALASDKTNDGFRATLNADYRDLSSAITDLINAVSEGAVGARMIKQATEALNRSMAALDKAALQAVSGSLKPSGGMAGASEKQANDNVISVAKEMAAASTGFVGSTRGTEEQLGEAAMRIADVSDRLRIASQDAASLSSDSANQQHLLNAARGVAITSSALLQSGLEAQASPSQASQQVLAKSATDVAESLKTLVSLTQAATAGVAGALIEIDRARGELDKALELHTDPGWPGKNGADTSDLVTSAKIVSEGNSRFTAAVAGGSPAELVSTAKELIQGTVETLAAGRAAGKQAGTSPAAAAKVDEKVRDLAGTVGQLIDAAKRDKNSPSPANRAALQAASGAVVDAINDVVDAAVGLPGGARAQEIFRTAENLEDMAQKELANAAEVITRATRTLGEAKARKMQEAVGEDDIQSAIMDAARAISSATGVLVSAASVVQRELVAMGKRNAAHNVFRRDPTWAKTLIGSAKEVSASVEGLVDAAAGKIDTENLIGSAKRVAAATAALVQATRAKGDAESEQHKKLQGALDAVTNATGSLVDAARRAAQLEVEGVTPDAAAQAAENDKLKEIEIQAQILALRKKIEQEQARLNQIRTADAKGVGSSDSMPTGGSMGKMMKKYGPATMKRNVEASGQSLSDLAGSPTSPPMGKKMVKHPSAGATMLRIPTGTLYSADELRGTVPAGVDPGQREMWLHDAEFTTLFGVAKDQYQKMPAWRRNDLKAKAGLQ